jgi:8-oxo-dGTP diphosphatase
MMQVVCAIIRRVVDGPVLLCRRAPGRSWEGFYEFPGGKIEPGETPQSALSRELIEELHLMPDQFQVGVQVDETTYGGGNDGPALRLTAYAVTLEPGCTLPGEPPLAGQDFSVAEWPVDGLPAHDHLVWVPPGQIASYRLPPADVPIARDLDSA